MGGSNRPKRKPPPGWKALDNREREEYEEQQREERHAVEEARRKRGKHTDAARNDSSRAAALILKPFGHALYVMSSRRVGGVVAKNNFSQTGYVLIVRFRKNIISSCCVA